MDEPNKYSCIDYKEPRIYKDLKYKCIYFLSDIYIDDKILEFFNFKNSKIDLNQIVTLELDEDENILSFSYVSRRYLGPDKLYYFYNSIGVSNSNIEVQMYEITKKHLYLMNNYPEFIGNVKYLGIILETKNENLITNLNLKCCDTPYQEGTVYYDNFDDSELMIESIKNLDDY
jgi:hypothetical protein